MGKNAKKPHESDFDTKTTAEGINNEWYEWYESYDNTLIKTNKNMFSETFKIST